MELSPCAECGSDRFQVRYTEVAWQDLNAAGELGDDGYELEQHEPDWLTVFCAKCNKRKELTTEERRLVKEKN